MRTGEEWGGLLLLGKPPLEEGDWYDYSQGFTEDALAEVARIARNEALEEAAEVAKKWAWDRHLEDCSGCGGRETIGDDVAEAIRALKKLPDISARPQPPPPARP